MKVYGVEQPYVEMDDKLELEGLSGISTDALLLDLVGSQLQRFLQVTDESDSWLIDEWGRILKSMVILARKYPDEEDFAKLLCTAIVWERG